MKNFTSNLKLFILLAAMVAGVNDVWAGSSAKVYAKAEAYAIPSMTGYIWVTIKGTSFNPNKDFTEDSYDSSETSGSNWQLIGTPTKKKTFTATYYAKPKDGYAFGGWYSDSNCTILQSNSSSNNCKYEKDVVTEKTSSPGEILTLYAKFTPNTYTVTFNANGGTCSPASKTVTFDATYGELATATRSDYLFAGWFTAATDGTQVTASSTVQIANNHTLYAHWQPLFCFSATANKNTATENTVTAVVANASITGTVGQTSAQTTATFTATPNTSKGYNFAGWYIDEACTNRESVESTYSTTLTNTVAGSTQNKTLYAKFVQQLTPEFTGADQTLKVEDTYTGFAFRNTSTAKPTVDGDFYFTILENTPSCVTSGSTHSSEIIGYNPETNTLTAYNAGTAKIKFAQKAVGIYEAAEITYTITVTKHENHISINGSADSYTGNIYTDAQLAIAFTATNTDYTGCPIAATQTAGDAVATLAAGKVSSNHTLGTATWSVSQPENYKYLAANASLTINVIKQDEATDCYVKNLKTTVIEKKLGNYSDNYTWEDENAAGVLYFSAKRQGASVGDKIKVEQLVEGSWSVVGGEITGYGTSYTSEHITLNSQAKGIRFWVAGSLNNYITNVRVTRKTYLNAADVTVNKTSGNNLVCPGDQGVGTLVINRSLANGGDLKITWDNAKFTINGKTSAEGVNLGNLDCTTGISELPILFNADAPGTEVAHVTIYNDVYHATATISGEAVKRTQDFDWHIDNTVSTGFSIATADAFTSTRSPYAGVTYTFSNTAIMGIEDGHIVAKAAGDVTITAHVDGGAEYQDLNETKTVTVTEDLVQSITWTQSLLGLKLGNPDLTLTATATSDVPGCTTNGSRLITYESGNEAIVKVINGNQLQIVGLGTTKLIARQAGGVDADGHTYIAVEIEKKVVVKDPSAPCETFVYEQEDNWEGDLGWNAVSNEKKTVEFNFLGNEPGDYTLEYSGKPHTVAIQYYDGALYIDEYYDGAWHNVQSLGKPTANVYATATHSLNRKSTKMRVRAEGKTGYYYAKDCQVTLARYIELQDAGNVVSNLAFSTKCGASQTKDVTVHYSNLTDNLNFSLPADCPFTLDKTSMEASCGDKGTLNLKITYTPMAPETDATYDLTISDGTTTTVVTLHASATISARELVWEQTPATTYTIQTVNFTAKAQTTLGDAAGSVAYTITSSTPADMASISGSSMSFTKAGNVTVEAAAVPDARYTMPEAQTKTWTIIKTPTQVTTAPVITTTPLVAGNDIAMLTFTDGAVADQVLSQEVPGTFAITSSGALVAGSNTINFTFTPDDEDMYLPCTTSVEISVFNAYVFEGDGSNPTIWGADDNWNTGEAPTADDNVVINANVTIAGDVEVKSLTINPGALVSVEVTGTLTVGDGDAAEQPAYGDLTIHDGGKVNLTTGQVNVNNFTIEAIMASEQGDAASSGQLTNASQLEANGEAFFDLKLTPSGVASYGWYEFAVPFPVDIKTGIYYGTTQLVSGVDFLIKNYHGDVRANGQYAWKNSTGVLQPGVYYLITVDEEAYGHLRLRKTTDSNINNSVSTLTMAEYASANAANAGWNGLGNPCLNHINIGNFGGDKVQVYSHENDAFSAIETNDISFVVGSPFFAQYANTPAMPIEAATNSTLHAPARANNEIGEYCLRLGNNDETFVDQLFFSATDDATATYQAGHDLVKITMSSTAKVPQLAISAYGMKLCDAELAWQNDEATFPLSITAPKAGDYLLYTAKAQTGTELYLLRNGAIIWNLSDADYPIHLDAGTTTEYSLLVRKVQGIATDINALVGEVADAEKFIYDGHIYIRRDHSIYTVSGQHIQ